MNTIHSGTNAKLNDISAALLLLGVGFACESFPAVVTFKATPWWPGLARPPRPSRPSRTPFFAGRLGGGAFNGLVVTGTIVFSIILDHYGLLGFSVHPASLPRIAGAVLTLGGLALVCLF